MTNDTEHSIRPSLRKYEASDTDPGYAARSIVALITDVLPVGGHRIIEPSPDGLRRIAALANHALPDGDPRKITRADVARLRREYDAIMDAQSDEFWDAVAVERANGFKTLAAKLAALLPPE